MSVMIYMNWVKSINNKYMSVMIYMNWVKTINNKYMRVMIYTNWVNKCIYLCNYRINTLHETGIISYLSRKWTKKKRSCVTRHNVKAAQLNIRQTFGIFYIMALLLLGATCCLFIECIVYKLKNSNITLGCVGKGTFN